MLRTLAHVSDLHLGAGPDVVAKVEALCDTLLEAAVDHVVVTGDLTESGRNDSFRQFEAAMAPLLDEGRVTIIPGNHDRLGDDVGARFMRGVRVDTVEVPGLYLVRVDSTGPHNRAISLASHGVICERVLDDVSAALERAPADALVAVLLHHHPWPLPSEGFWEWWSVRLGLPFTQELRLGEELLHRALGRCDLVLHGHRHVPAAPVLDPQGARPLRVYNAGSSVERSGMNVFAHAGGRLRGEPVWLSALDRAVRPAPYQAGEYRFTRLGARIGNVRAA